MAHYTKVRRQQLADVDRLEATVRDRLVYGCLRALEAQVINGDGVSPNLRGIMRTSGVAQITCSAS